MARRATVPAAGVLLVGPTVLAFFSGGYFSVARLCALLAAWALVLVVAVTGREPLPRSRAGLVAAGSLAALTAWTAIALAWAPLGGAATDSLTRALLYLGALLAGAG